jgi:osmotically-inducible protein OsmY
MNEPLPGFLADIDLAAAISASLHLQLDGTAPDITVTVNGGAVTLEGHVATEAQRDAAERIARRFDIQGLTNVITVSAQRMLSGDGLADR